VGNGSRNIGWLGSRRCGELLACFLLCTQFGLLACAQIHRLFERYLGHRGEHRLARLLGVLVGKVNFELGIDVAVIDRSNVAVELCRRDVGERDVGFEFGVIPRRRDVATLLARLRVRNQPESGA
jgi:hypothetical protein